MKSTRKTVREAIIKYFAFSHVSKVMGVKFSPARATTPLVSSFMLLVIGDLYFQPNETVAVSISLAWFIFCYYLGFYYFRKHPVNYEELQDTDQKWVLGAVAPWELPWSQEIEWQNIDIRLQEELKKSNRNVLPVLLPLILIIVTIVMYTQWDFLKYTLR